MADNPDLPYVEKLGKPRIVETLHDTPCQHCGCSPTFRCEVDVKDSRVRGGTGMGSYRSCAGCGWRSAMGISSKEGGFSVE